MIERIKNSDRNARRGEIDRKKKEGVREGFHRKAERRVLERRVAGLTFGRGRRKRNQLVVRFRNTDLLAFPPLPRLPLSENTRRSFLFSFHRRETNGRGGSHCLRYALPSLRCFSFENQPNIVRICASRALHTTLGKRLRFLLADD